MQNLRVFETTDEYNGENCSLENNTVSYLINHLFVKFLDLSNYNTLNNNYWLITNLNNCYQ